MPGDHAHSRDLRPAERRTARDDAVVDVVAQQGVEDERLEPRVPRTSRLGRPGIHLGGGERDLARVQQQPLAEPGAVLGAGELLDVLLRDRDRRTHEVDGLPQRDGPHELAWRRAEHVGRDGLGAVGIAEPLHEGGDARLGDQVDPGPVLGGHGAVPGELGLHPRGRLRGQASGRALEAPHGCCSLAGRHDWQPRGSAACPAARPLAEYHNRAYG